MALSQIETFGVSIPSVPPGIPKLFGQRLRDLGFGNPVDRDVLKELCGSESAANQFLAKASKMGALVPTAWGEYRVASEGTIQLLSRTGHPVFRRFVSWSRHLPDLAEDQILFVAPYLWERTDLNVAKPMPLVPLDPDQRTLEGDPPQWETFYMDVEDIQRWELVLGDESIGRFATPAPLDIDLILRASLDPRWRHAADALPERQQTQRQPRALDRLHLDEAPRGNTAMAIGVGPPQRRRLLAPPWYMQKVKDGALRSALGEDDRDG